MILNHLSMRMVVESKKSIYIRVILPIYRMRKKVQCAVLKKLRKIENLLDGLFFLNQNAPFDCFRKPILAKGHFVV